MECCCHDKWMSANSVLRFWTRCELCGTKMLGVWNAAQCTDCGWYMHDSCAAALKQTLERFRTTESNIDAIVSLKDEELEMSDHVIAELAEELTYELENSVSVHTSIAVELQETKIGLQTTGHNLAEYTERKAFRRAEGSVSNEKDARKSGAKPVITMAAGSGRSCLKTPNTADFEQVHVENGRHTLHRICHGPKLWNPVRVGPPLLIPIAGGPILITPPDDGQSDFDPIYYGLEMSKPVRKDPPPIWNPVRVGPPLLIPINGGPIWVTPDE